MRAGLNTEGLTEEVNGGDAPLGLVSVVFELIGLVEVLDTDFAALDAAGRNVDVVARFLAFSPNDLIAGEWRKEKMNEKRETKRRLAK